MCFTVSSPADVDAQVSTDATGLGVSRVGLTQHHPGQLHNVLTLPHLKHTHKHTCHLCGHVSVYTVYLYWYLTYQFSVAIEAVMELVIRARNFTFIMSI